MTVGMKTIARIQRIRERSEKLGFEFVEDEYSKQDEISLAVMQDKLPALRHGSVVFTGDLDEVDAFTNGIAWARWYDIALGLKTDKRREVSEQKLRNKLLLRDLQETAK